MPADGPLDSAAVEAAEDAFTASAGRQPPHYEVASTRQRLRKAISAYLAHVGDELAEARASLERAEAERDEGCIWPDCDRSALNEAVARAEAAEAALRPRPE